MKKTILIASVVIFAAACNSGGEADKKGTDSSGNAGRNSTELVYPYKLDKGYRDWQPGDQKHAVTVMNSLKGFENGDLAACMAGFGDSVDIYFDNYREKMSHDSLSRFFAGQRAMYKSMRIDMQDWESVIAKDGKDEWVTLWYKELWTDQKGVTDSLAVIDDAKIVNGKIVLLDEKIQHYPAKKK